MRFSANALGNERGAAICYATLAAAMLMFSRSSVAKPNSALFETKADIQCLIAGASVLSH